ncbi:MAG: monovalent cation/H(+) antiporter subunit G [Lachnospiraceae bacterium]|nr:monovalent cation/H(+) antiporter subunit G [Lachnospiraceae bacterium]
MGTLELIRFIAGIILLSVGFVTFLTELVGVFHFKYVLNRMHAAGMGDTLGVFSSMLGLIIINGLNMTSVKFGLIIVFLWFTSPVATHMLAEMECGADGQYKDECRVSATVKELGEDE